MIIKCILFTAVVMTTFGLNGCVLGHDPAVFVTGIVEDATESQESKDKRMSQLVGQFRASGDTTTILRKIAGDKTISVGAFASFKPGLNKLMCRLDGMVYAPLFVPFSELIRDGMIENLKAAGIYAPESPVVLTGRLNAIDFSSHSGNWTMSLTMQSSNGQSLTVTDKYEFEVGFGGQSACSNVREALMPAVHSLLDKVINEPGFLSLI